METNTLYTLEAEKTKKDEERSTGKMMRINMGGCTVGIMTYMKKRRTFGAIYYAVQ